MSSIERRILAIGLIAILLIPFGAYVAIKATAPSKPIQSAPTVPTPGLVGSQHWHISFIMIINGKRVDFGYKKYMLQSKLTHFEDDDPSVIHTHATGITLPFFLETLKIFLTDNCIDFENLDPVEKYCTNATSSLHTIVNGKDVNPIAFYELQNNDRILVTYGSDTSTYRKFLFNQVPPVPIYVEKKTDPVGAEPADIEQSTITP